MICTHDLIGGNELVLYQCQLGFILLIRNELYNDLAA